MRVSSRGVSLAALATLGALFARPALAEAQGAAPPPSPAAATAPAASPPPPSVPPLGMPPGLPSGATPPAPGSAPPPSGPGAMPAPFGVQAPPQGPPPAGLAPPMAGYGAPPAYGYAPPATYGLPPPYAPMWPAPRTIEDYEPGEAVPPGYHVETRAHRGLVIGGAVTFSSAYLLSVLGAVAGATDGAKGPKRFLPLLVPVAGPFITIGTADSKGAGTSTLVLDGLAQTGGVVLFIVGLYTDQALLVRNDVRTSLVPEVELGPRSGSLRWSF